MKNNNLTPFLIFVVLVLTIGAVLWLRPHHHHHAGTEQVAKNALSVYFSKAEGTDMVTVAVIRPLPAQQNDEFLLTTAISDLLKGPTPAEQTAGYFSEIPAGTHLNSVKAYPEKLVIDLSQAYTSGGGSNSMIQRYRQLAKTILAVPQKKPVYVTIEGKSLDILGGEGLVIHEPIINDATVNP